MHARSGTGICMLNMADGSENGATDQAGAGDCIGPWERVQGLPCGKAAKMVGPHWFT